MGRHAVRGWGCADTDPHPCPFALQVTSNLGKLILKEEMEKSLPIRRKTRSLPDRTPFHTCMWDALPAAHPFPTWWLWLPAPLPAPAALPAPLTVSCSLVALHMGSYKSSSLPASGRSTLTRVSGQAAAPRAAGATRPRTGSGGGTALTLSPVPLQLQSAEFSSAGSDKGSPGEHQPMAWG